MAEWSEDHMAVIGSLNSNLAYLIDFDKLETGQGP
jgi:hypothetical protein